MTQLRLENLTTVENIKAFLAGLVVSAFEARGNAPVRLTYVGGEFAKIVGVTFEKQLNSLADSGQLSLPRSRRKLAQFVVAYCSDIFDITENPAGVYFVAPKGYGEGASPEPTGSSQASLRFHRAVWAAFIRPIDDKRRFLNLDQIGFTDAFEKPALGNWREIPKAAVLGAARGAKVDGAELQARIEQWAADSDVPISRLVIASKPLRQGGYAGEGVGQLGKLLDLIDALPVQVAAQWSIPATVLKHLRDKR